MARVRISRVTVVLGACVALLVGAAGPAAGGGSGTDQVLDVDGTGSESSLYVQTAEGGRLRGGEDGAFTLQLTGVASRMTTFSDRPLRLSAQTTVADFVDDWDASGFADDPPNAALVISDGDDGRDTFVFELTNPDHDDGADTLRYDAQLLSDAPGGRLSALADPVGDDPPKRFGAASLFIDDAPTAGIEVTVDGVAPDTFGRILVNYGSTGADAVFTSENIISGGPGTILGSINAWGVYALSTATEPTSVSLSGSLCVAADGSEPLELPVNVSGATSVKVALDDVPEQTFGPGNGTLRVPPAYFDVNCGG